MNPDLERTVREIVAQTFSDDRSADRQAIEKSLIALAKHQSDFFAALDRRLNSELNSARNDWSSDFTVATKLAPRNRSDELRREGYFLIEIGSSIQFDGERSADPFEKIIASEQSAFFLDAPYDQLDRLCDPKNFYRGRLIRADGSATDFRYRLQRHARFIRHEQTLFEAAELYRLERPVIYSPYARRAVDIIIDHMQSSPDATLDFRLKDNALDGKLITDRTLYWNVTEREDRIMRDREIFGVDGSLLRYEYDCVFDLEDKNFVLPGAPCEDVVCSRDEFNRKITFAYHSLIPTRECRVLTLHDAPSDARDEVFTNEFPLRPLKPRLRTESDVEYVLSLLNSARSGREIGCRFVGLGRDRKNIGRSLARYSERDRYLTPKDSMYFRAAVDKPTIVLRFEGESRWLIDYAEYVLHFLETTYPEYRWAGVAS